MDKDIDSEILIKMYDKFKSVLPRSNEILQIHRNHEFYERLINDNGFTEFRKTYEPEVDIQQLIKRFLNEDFEGKHTSGKFKMTDALLKITEHVYRSIHEMNPLKRMDLSEWKDIITDDLDFEHSIIIYDRNDEIIAYLMMYENEEPFKDVGYCYFKNQEAKNSLSAEFHDTLLELKKQNFTHLNLEVDNTDIYPYEFFHDFIEHDPPSLISYMKTENK
ncbi:hypothetical protein [Lacicoccus qingdaonensis]|uniref:Uncharacterized protein n=1 Tax=Lacicoccus qingdaonensis TaxID=576118 RepID=A0A1G9GLU7_9BACL|nr:hypothetical protein [Salinicoccus qingdaonensis]SDL01637.1 hypothetical protein SAMN05216216_11813 [Salinicoccus qingdaonensis]